MTTELGFFDILRDNSQFILTGLKTSLLLTVVAMTAGIFFGTLLALARLSSIKPLQTLAAGYVNLFRSVPLVMVIFWFYFMIPLLTGQAIGAEKSAFITFTIFEAAYYCEIIRAGIQSIPRGQVWAGYALGLTYRQTTMHVVLPQAFRNMLPILLTQTIVLFQDTALVTVISAKDFFESIRLVANNYGSVVPMFVFAAVAYFAISYSLSLTVKRLHKKIAIVR